ncbi:MAG: tetratricopeptide repeat protein [Planctomycetes bacterium]|nr:tetratricopeptide repeat protein [Planctomycetota bacterium]
MPSQTFRVSPPKVVIALNIARNLTLVLALASHGYICAAEAPLPDRALPPQARLETVVVVADHAPVRAGDKVVATAERGRMFGVVERRADEVEVLVCAGTDVRRGTLQTSHVKFLTGDDVDLAAEWLGMARDLSRELDVPACKAKLDALIERVAAAAATGKTPQEKARLIAVQLFGREGLTTKEGAREPDHLLERKEGDCLGFSLLYLCIGQRLRMPLCLVIAPEHAFVRYEDRSVRFNMESTQQGKVHDTDAYLREALGAQRFSQIGGIHLVSLPVPSALGALLDAWGAALEAMGKPSAACEKFARAVEINPRHAEAYSNWGVALQGMGKPAAACGKFAQAVEICPRFPAAYSNWGVALEAMGKASEACEKYAKAVEINPRYAEAYSNWGVALRAMGRAAEACDKYARAVEANPQYAEAYSNWGVALRAMGKAGEACEKFAKAAEANPRYAEAYINWGLALAALGKAAEALEKLDRALALDPALKPKAEELRKQLQGKK